MSRLDDLLEQARAGVRRLTPEQAREAQARGALLVDTRTEAQRARQGDLPGALVIDRTVLEQLACECYGVVKKETSLLLHYLPQRHLISNTDSIPTAKL